MRSARIVTTRSASFSLSVSHPPRRSAYGAYCTWVDITCIPGGARSGSTTVGTKTSRTGFPDVCPYFAWSYARSMYSREGQTRKWGGTLSPAAGRFGGPGSVGQGVRKAPQPSADKGGTGAVSVGQELGNEPECGSGGPRSLKRSRQCIDRVARFEQLRLEPLVQKISNRHRRQAEHLLHRLFAKSPEAERAAEETRQLAEARRCEVGGWHREDRIERCCESAQEFDEPRGCVRVFLWIPREFRLGLRDAPAN